MWSELPLDILWKILSLLEPDSLACASSTCRYWHKATKSTTLTSSSSSKWFMALPTRRSNTNNYCYALNPVTDSWHAIPTKFSVAQLKPVASTRTLILFLDTTRLRFLAGNPFTGELTKLPPMSSPRSNPAVCVESSDGVFRVHAAGGTRAGGSEYDHSLEVYDSRLGAWRVVSESVPPEIAVRLTVWTAGEGVWVGGEIYWITAARAFSVMVYDGAWSSVRVPMAESLEFAAVVERKGRAAVVGGAWNGEARVWELGGDGDEREWVLVGEIPAELGERFLGEKGSWAGTKCASGGGTVILYGSLRRGVIVWKEVQGKWVWSWVDGCRIYGGERVPDLQFKGLFLHPTLSSSC